ncbi:MAG: hypothetical protein ACEPOV_10905 [Hyphomicrobiales bacterium]
MRHIFIAFIILLLPLGYINAQTEATIEEYSLQGKRQKDQFGHTIIQYNKNKKTIVTAPLSNEKWQQAGAVYIYNTSSLEDVKQKITSPHEKHYGAFGFSVDKQAKLLAIGQPGWSNKSSVRGSVFLYTKEKGKWIYDTQLKPEKNQLKGRFGYSIGIHKNLIYIGAPNFNKGKGCVFVFRKNKVNRWEQIDIIEPKENDVNAFGKSISVNNNTVAIGAPNEDINKSFVYLYKLNSQSHTEKIKRFKNKKHSFFGRNVIISKSNLLFVSAEGKVFIYNEINNSGQWKRLQTIGKKDNPSFGKRLSVNNAFLAISAPKHNKKKGSLYLYAFDSNENKYHKFWNSKDLDIKNKIGKSLYLSTYIDNTNSTIKPILYTSSINKNKTHNLLEIFIDKGLKANSGTNDIEEDADTEETNKKGKLEFTDHIRIENVKDNESTRFSITLKNTSNDYITIDNISHSQLISFENSQFTIAPNRTYILYASINPKSHGHIFDNITLHGNNIPTNSRIIIEADVVKQDEYEPQNKLIIEKQVDIPSINLGSTKEFSFYIVNPNNTKVSIYDIDTPEHITISSYPETLEPNQKMYVKGKYFAFKTGELKDKITIISNLTQQKTKTFITAKVILGGTDFSHKADELILVPGVFDKRLLVNFGKTQSNKATVQICDFFDKVIKEYNITEENKAIHCIPTNGLKKGKSYTIKVIIDGKRPQESTFFK